MHERPATYRTIGPYDSATYGDCRKFRSTRLPRPPAFRRFVPAKVVAAGAIHYAAIYLSAATEWLGLLDWFTHNREEVRFHRRHDSLPAGVFRRRKCRDGVD